MTELIITIDGPAGCGKSSTAKLLAEKLDAAFLDTGATYRAATLAAMKKLPALTDIEAIGKVIDETDFTFEITQNGICVKINGQDVTRQIRSQEVTRNVTFIASEAKLREKLVKMQRDFAKNYKKIVTEGRDQGTVVFPDADFKFFLTAQPETRTKRRAAELAEKGLKIDEGKLQRQIEQRDQADMNRSAAPLAPAKDAILIDNTNMTLEQTANKILKCINENDKKNN